MKRTLMIFAAIVILSQATFSQTDAIPMGTCIKKANEPNLYMVLGVSLIAFKYPIPSMDVYNKIYVPGAIKVLADSEVDKFTTREALSSDTKLAMLGDAVVLLSGDKLSWVENPDVMKKLGFSWSAARANKLQEETPTFTLNDKITVKGKTYTVWLSFK
jgi:hypothetical protein